MYATLIKKMGSFFRHNKKALRNLIVCHEFYVLNPINVKIKDVFKVIVPLLIKWCLSTNLVSLKEDYKEVLSRGLCLKHGEVVVVLEQMISREK